MSDSIKKLRQSNAALITAAEQAYDWSGVFPTVCLPGVGPLEAGELAQNRSQMVRNFKRHKNGMVGLLSSPKGLAILVRTVPVRNDHPSDLAKRFFDPDRFLVTRTKTSNLATGSITLNDSVVLKSPFGFPLGMRTNDPTVVLVPDGSSALFSPNEETVVAYQRSRLVLSIRQLNRGTFKNREIMEPSGSDWAILLGRNPI